MRPITLMFIVFFLIAIPQTSSNYSGTVIVDIFEGTSQAYGLEFRYRLESIEWLDNSSQWVHWEDYHAYKSNLPDGSCEHRLVFDVVVNLTIFGGDCTVTHSREISSRIDIPVLLDTYQVIDYLYLQIFASDSNAGEFRSLIPLKTISLVGSSLSNTTTIIQETIVTSNVTVTETITEPGITSTHPPMTVISSVTIPSTVTTTQPIQSSLSTISETITSVVYVQLQLSWIMIGLIHIIIRTRRIIH